MPDFGWTRTRKEEAVVQWMNAEQTAAFSIHFFNLPPDLLSITDVNAVRSQYRKELQAVNGGLIELNLLQKDSIRMLRAVIKQVNAEGGMLYIASLTIPFKNCSYVIKLQALEAGVNGMRDALVGERLLASGKLSLTDAGLAGWTKDPYDPAVQDGVLMNLSEESSYDEEFPNHPLSLVRSMMAQVISDMQFEPVIARLEPF